MARMDDFSLGFRLQLRGELLRYAVGRQMFCKHEACGQVMLDCDDAVLLEVTQDGNTRTQVLCSDCFEERTELVTEDEWDAAVASGRIEVTDGRELRRFNRALGLGDRV